MLLLGIGRERSTVAVLDEFPYLALASRALPSIIQQALTPGRRERTTSRTRLLLCGSAMSFMGRMLSGTAPLRGRAGLELRVWVAEFAASETLGGVPATVGHGAVNDAAGRTSHEVDIVALGDPGSGPRPVLALGETKWGEQMGLSHLGRLRHSRGLLERHPGIDTTGAKLLCASGSGFTPELHAAADASGAILLDLDRLYRPE